MKSAPSKISIPLVAFLIDSCFFTSSAAIGKPVVQAVQDMETSSPSDSQGFVWMFVCIGLLVLVASTLIIATISYSYRKKKPDSGK